MRAIERHLDGTHTGFREQGHIRDKQIATTTNYDDNRDHDAARVSDATPENLYFMAIEA